MPKERDVDLIKGIVILLFRDYFPGRHMPTRVKDGPETWKTSGYFIQAQGDQVVTNADFHNSFTRTGQLEITPDGITIHNHAGQGGSVTLIARDSHFDVIIKTPAELAAEK